jgi:hypothetical protein
MDVKEIGNKLFPIHAIKGYRGRRSVDPPILNIGTAWK